MTTLGRMVQGCLVARGGCSGLRLKYIEPAYILISIAGGALVMTHRQYLYDRVSICLHGIIHIGTVRNQR